MERMAKGEPLYAYNKKSKVAYTIEYALEVLLLSKNKRQHNLLGCLTQFMWLAVYIYASI